MDFSGLKKLSNGSAIRLCGLPIRLLPPHRPYDTAVGGQPVADTFPPSVSLAQLSQHQLSFLFFSGMRRDQNI